MCVTLVAMVSHVFGDNHGRGCSSGCDVCITCGISTSSGINIVLASLVLTVIVVSVVVVVTLLLVKSVTYVV